jgi:SAM-dependent methyltransferase
MLADDETRRRSFDQVAREYEAARPGYPDALFDDLCEAAGAKPGSSVLEIASGTGKATRSLARRGLRVTCVEAGANLAAVAREVLAGLPIEIHVCRFEDWEEPAAAFDLAACGQAYHWIDPEVAGPKIARALRPGAPLGCFWNHVTDRVPWLDDIYREVVPELDYDAILVPTEDRIAEQRARVEKGGSLEVVGVRRHPWTMRKTADEYVRLIDTYSEHRTLPTEKQARLYPAVREAIAAHGGVLERPVVAYLLIARARTR